MKTDVLIVGAGPAGIFTALEMLRKGSKKKIMIVEKGAAIERRHCPKVKSNRTNCFDVHSGYVDSLEIRSMDLTLCRVGESRSS